MKRAKRTKQVDIVSLRKKKNWVLCLPPFRLTPHWIRGRVACLPSLGWGSWFMFALPWAGKVVYGYFLLGDLVSRLLHAGERVGCMITLCWGRGWVFWLLPAGEVGLMVTSHWGSWFQGYSPLGERVGCLISPHWGRGWVFGLLPAGKLV